MGAGGPKEKRGEWALGAERQVHRIIVSNIVIFRVDLFAAPLTLRYSRKSSGMRAILWLIRRDRMLSTLILLASSVTRFGTLRAVLCSPVTSPKQCKKGALI
jgi:hypothetical protein